RACVGRRLPRTNQIIPTRLFPYNVDVDRVNLEYLEELPGKSFEFQFKTNWTLDEGVRISSPLQKIFEKHQKTLVDNCIARNTISLKKGAQVVLLANLDFKGELVNGSRGVVHDIDLGTGYPIV